MICISNIANKQFFFEKGEIIKIDEYLFKKILELNNQKYDKKEYVLSVNNNIFLFDGKNISFNIKKDVNISINIIKKYTVKKKCMKFHKKKRYHRQKNIKLHLLNLKVLNVSFAN